MELFFFLSSERPAVPFESDPLTNRRYQFLIVPFFAFLKAAQRVQSNVADNCADSQLRFSHLIRRRDLNYVTIIQHHNAPLVSRVIRTQQIKNAIEKNRTRGQEIESRPRTQYSATTIIRRSMAIFILHARVFQAFPLQWFISMQFNFRTATRCSFGFI